MASATRRAFSTLLAHRTLTGATSSSYARLAGSPSSAQAFKRLLSSDTKSKIQKAIEADPLVLFMKGTPQIPQCGFSRAVVQIMEVQGVPREKMQTYNCLEDQDLREGIKEFSDWPTIPQIYLKGEFIGGCDIILGMHQSGELATLLADNGIIPKQQQEQPTPTDAGAS